MVDALTAGSQACNQVIVDHWLASIRRADRVLFIDGDQVIEDGGLDELLTVGGCFGGFWRSNTMPPSGGYAPGKASRLALTV